MVNIRNFQKRFDNFYFLIKIWLYWVIIRQHDMKASEKFDEKWKFSCENIWPYYLVGFEDFCGHLRAEQSWVQSCLLMRYVGGHHGVNTFIECWALSFYIQLNEYETVPYLLQLSQNLTSDCLLVSVFTSFPWCDHKIVLFDLQNNFMIKSWKN